MFVKYLILLFCVNLVGVFCNIYEKNDNAYELIHGTKALPKSAPGYVEISKNLLEEFKNGKVPVSGLNKFSLGLEEYFLYVLYEKDAFDLASNSPKPEDIPDPVSLSDYEYENIAFKNVRVYGLPSTKAKNLKEIVYETKYSVFEYAAKLVYKSGIVIFTADLFVDNSPYFLVYHLKDVAYQTFFTGVRSVREVQYLKASLKFLSEELIHTFDSSSENFLSINKTIETKFNDLIRTTYLLKIFTISNDKLQSVFLDHETKYLTSHKKELLSALIDSAAKYVEAKALGTFEVNSLNFTTQAGPRSFTLTYKNIKVEGILNYAKYEFVNDTIELQGPVRKISSAIQFLYSDGENQPSISFVVADGRRENVKKFKIKSITIIAVYDSSLLVRPYVVTRNEEVFLNKSGFLIKFELEDFDPTYEFLIRHVGNDISRAIEATLTESA